MNMSANNSSRSFLVAIGLATLAAVTLGFGASASAGAEPIEPFVPEFPDLAELPKIPFTLPDDFGPIPLPDDPIETVPEDLAPIPTDPTDPTDPADPTDPTDPTDPGDPGLPQDPTPGTPHGFLPETGASSMVVGGLALAATTAGAFLCLAAGRRSRSVTSFHGHAGRV